MSIYTDERVMSKHGTDKRTDGCAAASPRGGDGPAAQQGIYVIQLPRVPGHLARVRGTAADGRVGAGGARVRGKSLTTFPSPLPRTRPFGSGRNLAATPRTRRQPLGQAVVPICAYEYMSIHIPDAPSSGASARVRGTAANGSSRCWRGPCAEKCLTTFPPDTSPFGSGPKPRRHTPHTPPA